MSTRGDTCPAWRLTRVDLLVYVALYQMAESKPAYGEIRQGDIAIRCRVSVRTVLRSLRRLEDAGLVMQDTGKVHGRPSAYTMARPCCRWLSDLVRGRVAVPRMPRGRRD